MGEAKDRKDDPNLDAKKLMQNIAKNHATAMNGYMQACEQRISAGDIGLVHPLVLRVAVDVAASEAAALGRLLIAKGIVTPAELAQANLDSLQAILDGAIDELRRQGVVPHKQPLFTN